MEEETLQETLNSMETQEEGARLSAQFHRCPGGPNYVVWCLEVGDAAGKSEQFWRRRGWCHPKPALPWRTELRSLCLEVGYAAEKSEEQWRREGWPLAFSHPCINLEDLITEFVPQYRRLRRKL